jgi:hypothetical protein
MALPNLRKHPTMTDRDELTALIAYTSVLSFAQAAVVADAIMARWRRQDQPEGSDGEGRELEAKPGQARSEGQTNQGR